MRLIVGTEDFRADLIDPAKQIWQRFMNDVPDLPCEFEPVTFMDVFRHAAGVAGSFLFAGPRYRNEYALFVLSTGFFDKDASEQTLTLLHECIHLRFMTGPLRERAIENIELDRVHRLPDNLSEDEYTFRSQRVYLAFSLRNFIDEILAEMYLRSAYATYLSSRIAYYLAMRRESLEEWRKAVATLHPTAIFHEILRNDLGIRLAEGHSDAYDFAAMSLQLQRQIRAVCSDDEYARFQALRGRMMNVQLEPVTFDAPAYADAFDRTMRLEASSGTVT